MKGPRALILRLRQHIEYAAAKGVLDLVDKFLGNLPRDDWYTWQIGKIGYIGLDPGYRAKRLRFR